MTKETNCTCLREGSESAPPIPEANDSKNQCVFPSHEPIVINTAVDSNDPSRRPVGVIIQPGLLGEKAAGDDQTAKFYPCQLQPVKIKMNIGEANPVCPKETSYQRDFIYRGENYLPCQNYRFQTDTKLCKFVSCDQPLMPRKRFGRVYTDLKPTSREIRRAAQNPPPVKDDSGARVSEYMAGVSKLGGEMLQYNLIANVLKRRQISEKKKYKFS